MQISTDLLDAAAAEVRAFAGRSVGALEDAALVEGHAAAARLVRAAEVVLSAFAGEVAQRSARELGASGLARKQGFRTPQQMTADATGGSLAGAHRLVEAGEALVLAGPSDEPGAAPAVLGPTGEALAAGLISMEAAALIRSFLAKLSGDTAELEARLVARAKRLPLGELRRACVREQALHDPAAWERRERWQHEQRFLTIGEDADGMVTFTGRLDPPSAAPVKAWLGAYVKDAFRRAQDPDVDDPRTAGQMRADGLVALASHALDCNTPTSGVKTTVVVRVGLAELESGAGIAECDELTAPISVPALRRMACDARVVPVVLGGASLPLDLGRDERLFTGAQRIALGERDGGCAWCLAPPSFCEAHHIRWWKRDKGRTDLSNGVLLCRSCHHRIHTTGWTIEVLGDQVWFLPPPDLVGSRAPVLGGKARLQAVDVEVPAEFVRAGLMRAGLMQAGLMQARSVGGDATAVRAA